MNAKVFAEAGNKILRIATGKEVSVEKSDNESFYTFGIGYLKAIRSLGFDEFITIQNESQDADMILKIADRIYKINGVDKGLDDPAIYTTEDALIANSAYTFVLIELGIWLSGMAQNKFEYTRFDIYYGVRKNFNSLLKDTYYSNKLWLKDSESIYVVTVADNKIIFVSDSETMLSGVLAAVGIKI